MSFKEFLHSKDPNNHFAILIIVIAIIIFLIPQIIFWFTGDSTLRSQMYICIVTGYILFMVVLMGFD